MSHIVLKYRIETFTEVITLPQSAGVLDVQMQNDVPTIWMLVDVADKKVRKRQFHVIVTGQQFDCDTLEHLATLQRADGIVCHVFEKVWFTKSEQKERDDDERSKD